MDLWPVDIRRFGSIHRDRQWVLTRTLEAYGKHYTMAWPHEEHESGRPVRISPLYQRLQGAGRVLRLQARLGAAELVRARRTSSRATSTPTAGRTGSTPSATSTARCASASGCSTRPRSPSS